MTIVAAIIGVVLEKPSLREAFSAGADQPEALQQ